jgi:arabinofuranosyltransferase
MTLSKAYIDYSTSGLENPLTHILAAVFFLLFLTRKTDIKTITLLSFFACLSMFNRLDTVLIYAPALLYILYQHRSLKTLVFMFIGFIPLFLWELFALFYYGFLFPNTAYAKLNTGIDFMTLVGQGLYYLYSSILIDPLTMVIIFTGIIIPFIRKQKRLIIISISMLFYLIYIIKIGGCFMSGRFFALPFLLGVIVLSQYISEIRRPIWWIPGLAVLLLGLIPGRSPVYTTAEYGKETPAPRLIMGIVDEKAWYFESSSFLRDTPDLTMPTHSDVSMALTENKPLVTRGTIGFYGFFSDPEKHILDYYGLADPLMARLPYYYDVGWRIGHFPREIPEGYEATVLSGINLISDNNLSEYYNRLELIVRGDLLDGNRLLTIIKMNLGAYDYLKEAYINRKI